MRRRVWMFLAVAGVFLAGCRVDAATHVRVREDGSGTVSVRVTLDADARARVAGSIAELSSAIRLDDLADAGWTVSPWKATKDDGAVITLDKAFARAQQLPTLITELNGRDGPLRGVTLRRTESFLGIDFATTAVIDLRAPHSGVTDDAALVTALQTAGVDPAAFETAITGDATGLTLGYMVDLPEAAPGAVTATAGERAALATSSTVRNDTRILALAVAAVLAVLAVLVLTLGARRARHARRPEH